MAKKKIVYLDMDGVLVDFHSHPELVVPKDEWNHPNIYRPGYFRDLKPMPGAIEAVETILTTMPEIDLHILTHGLSASPTCYQEKMEWIHSYLPVLHDKVIITCDKDLSIGDILIDDSLRWVNFMGRFIHFDEQNLLGAKPSWDFMNPSRIYRRMWQEVINRLEAIRHEQLH